MGRLRPDADTTGAGILLEVDQIGGGAGTGIDSGQALVELLCGKVSGTGSHVAKEHSGQLNPGAAHVDVPVQGKVFE